MKNTRKGFIVPLLVAVVAVLIAGSGIYFYTQNKSQPATQQPVTNNQIVATSTSQNNATTDKHGYSIKDDGLYWRGGGIISQGVLYDDYPTQKIATGSKSDFTILESNFAKSKSTVYLYGAPVSSLDVSSFKILSTSTSLSIVKDAKAVYSVQGASGDGIGIGYILGDLKKLENVDAPTFKILTKDYVSYVSDKNGIYTFNFNNGFSSQKLKDADPSTFKVLPGFVSTGEHSASQFSKDSQHVYFGTNLIIGADPSTFVLIPLLNGSPSNYAKDKTSVFNVDKKIDGADPQSFQLLAPQIWWADSLAKDKNRVYGIYNYDDKNLVAPNPNSLVLYIPEFKIDPKNVLGGPQSFYAKDAQNAYIVLRADDFGGAEWRRLAGTDVTSFVGIDEYYAKDKTAVYSLFNKLAGADPTSFEVLGFGVAKDNQHVYGLNKEISTSINLETFVVLGELYGKDKNAGYYLGSTSVYNGRGSGNCRINDADVSTLKLLGTSHAADSKSVYAGCQKIDNADPKTFTELENGYAKDKSHVFYSSKIVNADLASFVTVSRLSGYKYDASDKNYKYYQGTIFTQ